MTKAVSLLTPYAGRPMTPDMATASKIRIVCFLKVATSSLNIDMRLGPVYPLLRSGSTGSGGRRESLSAGFSRLHRAGTPPPSRAQHVGFNSITLRRGRWGSRGPQGAPPAGSAYLDSAP